MKIYIYIYWITININLRGSIFNSSVLIDTTCLDRLADRAGAKTNETSILVLPAELSKIGTYPLVFFT